VKEEHVAPIDPADDLMMFGEHHMLSNGHLNPAAMYEIICATYYRLYDVFFHGDTEVVVGGDGSIQKLLFKDQRN
jgi:hypothetical protein